MINQFDFTLFNIEKSLIKGELTFNDVSEKLPGFFHLNRLQDCMPIYYDQKMCEYFERSKEELIRSGSHHLDACVNKQDWNVAVKMVETHLKQEQEQKSISFIQRIRPNEKEDFIPFFTSTKVFDGDKLINISVSLRNLKILERSLHSILNETDFLKKNFNKFSQLSKREVEVMSHTCFGTHKDDMASLLNIQPNTIRKHLQNIYTKLGISSFAELYQFAKAFDVI